jgi:membrane fusion protein (multidrug efflux system)
MNKTPAPGRRPDRILLIPLAVLAVALATTAVGCNDKKAAPGAPGGAPAAGPRAGAPSMPPAKLPAAILRRTPASASLNAPGTVLAEQEVAIEAEISGRVVKLGFREGGPVTAGQVLVELDGAELKASAERAEATRLLAKTRADRARRDFAAQAVSQEEHDRVIAEWKAAEADAALARARWEKTRLRAPFAGTAGLREVELGAVVQPGARVTTLQNLASLRVEFSVPERSAGQVKPGMKVSFTVSGSPDTIPAEVYAVESRVDAETRLLRVRARSPPAAGRGVPPGSFARVTLPLRADSAVWIPAQAVVQSARGAQAWRVRGGVAELAPFVPGARDAKNVEAVSGLVPGDTILVSGLMQLRPGTPVIPVVSP